MLAHISQKQGFRLQKVSARHKKVLAYAFRMVLVGQQPDTQGVFSAYDRLWERLKILHDIPQLTQK